MALRLKVPISIHHEDIDYDDPNNDPSAQDVYTGLGPSFNPLQSSQASDVSTTPQVPQVKSGGRFDLPKAAELDPDIYNALKQSILAPPLKSNYEPSTKRKILGAIAGGFAGASGGPEAGMKTAQSITDKPYNDAYQDWITKTGALEKGTTLGIEANRARFSGLTGVGSYIRALNSGDPELQGEIAGAKDAAKSPTLKKEFEYYKSLPGNEKTSIDDFMNIRKSAVERISSQMVTADSAQARAAKGEVFKDKEGNIINPDDLRSTEGLVLISGGNGKDQRYERVDQTLKEFTAGNVRVLFPSRSGPNATIAGGPARVPSTTAKEDQAQTVEGDPVAQKLYTTTTPNNPGMTINPPIPGRPAPTAIPQVNAPQNVQSGPISQNTSPQIPQVQSPIIGPDLSGPVKNQTTQVPQVSQIPQQNNQAAPPNNDLRPLAAFSPAVAEQQKKYATPIKVAASQLFGDPSTGSKGLQEYAHLFDDKDAREKIGTAVKLLTDTFTQANESGESVGAELGGFGASANTGGLWSWFKNNTGITKKIAAADVRNVDNIMKGLNPEEREFVDKIFASYGSISGLRAATQGGAYKWSIDSLKKEIPVPPNAVSSKEYLNKLGGLGQIVVDAINDAGVSKQFLPRKDEYRELAKDLIRRGQVVRVEGEDVKKPKYKVEEVK